MWSHYAEKHHGMCLGFDVPDTHVYEVIYQAERLPDKINPLTPEEIDEHLVREVIATKFHHWQYESEVRMFSPLENCISENGLYFEAFSSELALWEVIVGPRSKVSRKEVDLAIGDYGNVVEKFRARLAFKTFSVVRNKNEALWD